ncbi:hypothetical protein BS78_03G062700 [Paspalum vaginatum]|nr:hypothetical protein BS78_03G062700 [Paspalum vaginatum]
MPCRKSALKELRRPLWEVGRKEESGSLHGIARRHASGSSKTHPGGRSLYANSVISDPYISKKLTTKMCHTKFQSSSFMHMIYLMKTNVGKHCSAEASGTSSVPPSILPAHFQS